MSMHRRVPARHKLSGLVLALAVGACLATALLALPGQDAPLPAVARMAVTSALPDWHSTEPVSVVVYGSRGFDTFGETFILLAAVIGVMVLSRARERRPGRPLEDRLAAREQAELAEVADGRPPGGAAAEAAEERERGRGPADERDEMTVVVRGGVRVVVVPLAVAGCYLVATGYAPGGGFPGGAVLAGVVMLAYVAFGTRRVAAVVEPDRLEAVELAFAALIVAIGVTGLVTRGSFWANFLPLGVEQTIAGGGIAQLFSGLELVEVATGVLLVFFSLVRLGEDWARGGEAGR